jgi:hypothetical protein
MGREGSTTPSSSLISKKGGHAFLPFWILQAVELAVAVVFVDISVHVSRGGILIGGAGAYALLCITAQGPLGIFRICPRRLHVRLAVVASVVLALSPIFSALRPDIEGIIVIEFGAIGVIRLATFTLTVGATPRTASRPHVPVIDTTASVVGSRPFPDGIPAPKAPSSGAAARWLGRTTAAATSSGKRVAEQHRPEAEAQVKRTIRGAGRFVGKLTSPSKEDPQH